MKPIEKHGITAQLEDLTQVTLERYQEITIEKSKTMKSAAAYNRLIVEAAIESGFLKNVPMETLPGMKPTQVKWLTEQVLAFVKEQTEVPNE